MLPNIPIEFPTLQSYIDAISGAKDQVVSQIITAEIAQIRSDIAALNLAVADIAALNENITNNASVAANTNHRLTTTGNPHNVTKAEVGLGSVTNHDFTAEVNANTAKVGITTEQTNAIIANTAKVGITVQQAADIVSNNAHRAIVAGNPHAVTKADVGLSNVPNTDCTNASNITTGMLPNSVLPPLAITDVYSAANEAEMLAINLQKGDIVVRGDLGKTFINITGANDTSADWQELLTPTDTVLSVNSLTGVVVLTTSNIAEGTNLYYTEARVIANSDVAANTANRHAHGNKAILDATTASFTTEQGVFITSNNAHRLTVAGNPHQVTKAEVGLGNVPNHDFTAEVNANTAKAGITVQQTNDIVSNNAHRATVVGNPHAVTKAEVGLGSVPNTDFTTPVANATTHIATVVGNPHAVTKAEVGLSNVPNTNFTVDVTANNAHRLTVTGNPHAVTKAEVGLSDVPNTNFTVDVTANNAHRLTVTGNPHAVTKAEVGLSNVPNVDCTNASNITTGILPSSVLPPLAITDTFVVTSEAEQLALAVIQKGDIAVRTDINRSYINKTGNNAAMTDWQELSTPTDTIQSVNGQTGTVVLTTTHITEGTNLYYTEARVMANSDVAANTANRHNHSNKAILDATTASFTTSQSDAIIANTAKVGITTAQADAIVANTAKVGITVQQAADIVSNNTHRATVVGNPHAVTKAEVGLGSVPNTDFTTPVANATTHIATVVGNPHAVTKADVGLGNVPNTNFTTNVASADAHIATVTGNPHQVTKTEVGLGNVTNHDFTAEVNANTAKVGITVQQAADIVSNNTHRATVVGNPHAVTKAEVGLGSVLNIDCTNASNITTGMLPSNVLPPVAITDTHVVASELAQLALIVERGDIAIRSDLNRTYINRLGANTAMTDWQELSTPTDSIQSVNGQTGTIVLTTTHIDEGTNLYYTEARVMANSDVAANTANRHNHGNKTILDATTASFTTEQGVFITSNNAHRLTVAGNPHAVTKAEVGLGNVPNTNFTSNVASADAHIATIVGNPHHVTKAEVGLGDVPNTNFTVDVTANNAHRLTVTGNPHAVTKAEVGLGNVPNVDCTNASNITTGTLPSSVLPPVAITDTFVVTSEVAQLALTVQKGDVAVRTDINRSYINKTGNNAAMTDWQELSTPTDTIQSVNGQTGTVVLTTTHIDEGTNLYYTEARVIANSDVAANTANRHNHANKTILDATTASFTTSQSDAIVANTAKVGITVQQAADIVSNNTHRATVVGNPHAVTKAEVGLGNVTNHDFTAEVNANTAKVGITVQQAADIVSNNTHRAIVAGNPHAVTKAEVGLGNVPNVDCTNASNITTGVLPSNVLPPLAITDTHVVASEVAQLALVVQQGDIVVRTDISRTYINKLGVNNLMTDWQELSTPTDSIQSINGQTGTVILTTTHIDEGTNLYYTEARVTANSNVAANTANRHNHANKTTLDATTAPFTTEQASAIVLNTAHKNTVTGNPHAVTKIEIGLSNVPNTDFTADVAANNAHRATVVGNPHAVTKTEVGLGSVPNHDFTAEVNANTAKVGITTQQSADIVSNNTHRATVVGNPHQVTKADVGLGNVPNTNFTTNVASADAHIATVVGNPHAVTKAEVGLGSVPNTDFTTPVANATTHIATVVGNPHAVTKAEVGLSDVPNTNFTTDVTANNAHRLTVTGNPHAVTKAEVGLGNVPNVDCTNASNITTGMLSSSILPPVAITDTYVVTSDAAQLALTVQKGDVAVRTDINRSYINTTGNNAAMTDWQELSTPTDTIQSVNGQTGTVVLTTTHITEGTNLYYTEARVMANSDVAANTANRHNHANKTILDATTASFTTELSNNIAVNNAKVGITVQQAADIVSNNTHRAIVAGNPHQVTKTEVGLSDVTNHDFTAEVNANTAHKNTTVGNPHQVTKADVGLGNVPNTNFTSNVASADAHIATVTGNPHQVTKAEVGLGNVTNHDFTAEVNANTAKVGITVQQAADIVSNNTHRTTLTGNPHQVTKTEVGLSNVPNTDFTAEVGLNTANRHSHSNKPILDATTSAFTTEQADEIVMLHNHRLDTTTNPHGITPIMIGAETPAGAQTKANIARDEAIDYANLYFKKSPAPALFDAPFRNSLALNQGVGLVRFERTSEASFIDRYGIRRDRLANVPRFNRSGLLQEGESTNYFAGSTDVSVCVATNCSASLNKLWDAAFEATVDVVTISSAGSPWGISKSILPLYLDEDKYVTFSVRLKSDQGITGFLKIKDSSGTIVGDLASKEITLTSELVRFEVTALVSVITPGHPLVSFEPSTLLAGSSFAVVDFQVEQLNFASSVIETTVVTGPVTRTAETVAIPHVENFPVGLNASKTVIIDVEVTGTTDQEHLAFTAGDMRLYVGNGVPNNRMTRVAMSAESTTTWVEKIGKFRFGATYDAIAKELKMYHDGILVATKTNITTADSPLLNISSINNFFSDIYPSLASGQGTTIAQIPVDILDSEILLGSGSPFVAISNIRLFDEALNAQQMLLM